MGNNRNRKSKIRWKPLLVTAFLLADCLGVYLVQVKLSAPVMVSAQDEALASAASVVPAWNPAAKAPVDMTADARLAMADAPQVAPYQASDTVTPMPAIKFDAAVRAVPDEVAAPALAAAQSGPDQKLLKLAQADIQSSQRLAKRLNFKVVRDPAGTQAVGFAKAFAEGTGSIDLPEPAYGFADTAAVHTDVAQLTPSAVAAEAPVADIASELPAISAPAVSDSAAPVASDAADLPPG